MNYPKDKLGNLLALEYGSALPEQQRTGFGFPVFGSSGEIGRHSQALIKGPGIIVGRKGSVGEVRWSREDFWPIDTTYFVVPKEGVNVRWLYWLLGSLYLKKLDAATGVPGLNRNDVYALSGYRARPEDQWRIAKVLDTVDESIAKTEAVIAKLRQVRAGLLHDLLTRGLDENGQLRDPIAHPEDFKTLGSLGVVPKAWQVLALEQVATLQRGFDLPIQHRRDGTIPVFGSNGTDGYHDVGKVKGPGVITGRSGSIGFVFYTDSDFWPLNTTLYVRDFHGNRSKFVRLLLESLRLERFSAATGVPSLNRNFVHPTSVAIPLPGEQERIVFIMEKQNAYLDSEEAYLRKLRALRSGLIADLLTGRVRVPEGII